VLGAFQDGWTFIVGAGLLAAVTLLSVGPVRIGAAEAQLITVPIAEPLIDAQAA
jgi:hypothetical protein